MSANIFDCNDNSLIKKASKNGWPTIRKVYSRVDLLAMSDPSDRNLRLEVEEIARKTYGFVGTESEVIRAGGGDRAVIVVNNPDEIGVV